MTKTCTCAATRRRATSTHRSIWPFVTRSTASASRSTSSIGCRACRSRAGTSRRSCATCRSIVRTTPPNTEWTSPRSISGRGHKAKSRRRRRSGDPRLGGRRPRRGRPAGPGQRTLPGRYACPACPAPRALAGGLARRSHLARGPRCLSECHVRHRSPRQSDRWHATRLQRGQQPRPRPDSRSREAGRARRRLIRDLILGTLRLQPFEGRHRERLHRAAGLRRPDLPTRERGLQAGALRRPRRAPSRPHRRRGRFPRFPFNYVFVQNGFNGNPVGIFFNAPGMTAYPNATWGGLVKVRPTERMYVMGGAYNGDVSIRANKHHGADWSMDGPLFAIGEVGYQINGLPGDQGLLGNYKAGFWYDDHQYIDFTTVARGAAPDVT